jgi:hypothetical protein
MSPPDIDGINDDVPQRERIHDNAMFQGSNHWSHHTAQGNDPGIPLPTSFASWVIGVLNRDRHPWFMEYVESSVFNKTETA